MIDSSATFSDDRVYRYALWRIWDSNLPIVNIIGLNPSTANENINDPTMRRCISFSKSWGYGGFYMTNLFAFRTPYPKELLKVDEPIGKKNDFWIMEIANKADKVVLAWGVNGDFHMRNERVIKMLNRKVYCIDKTKYGHPKHPLYLKSNLELIIF
ncbi:DUF1643 domain-containing protein [Ulvibacter antarcticus]|uniref:DUF1643 domain-containing protein n=1 Tax=Ulvibacter antarcticus TaxID=442714 RepID=A0A3L9Z1Y9_9FLAO|nr:DUF1643 domain-containing protein [Ulvibacter antarcticus]RMA66554.1 hypothetical protein BXY75_0981 [Ulvibacter antarcticus]